MRILNRSLLLCLSALLLTQPVFAAPDAAVVFQQRWQQHDQLVASGQASRSWTWGPKPLTGVIQEQYQVQETGEWRDRNLQ